MKWTKSLRGRLTAAMAVVFVLGAANVVIYLLDIDQDLRSHIMNKQVDALFAAEGTNSGTDWVRNLPTRFAEADWHFAVYDSSGALVLSSPDNGRPPPLLPSGQERIEGQSASISRPLGSNVLVVQKSDWQERQELRALLRVELAGSTFVIAALGILSFLMVITLAAWVLRSVGQAAALARRIDAADASKRIPIDDLPTEIRPLAVAANGALERLARAYASERRFTAEAAHELRTPLAVLGLRLQKARSEENVDWDSVDREMKQMARLVGQLTALARAESHAALPMETETISMSRVAREAVADMMLLFEDFQRDVYVEISDGLSVNGNAGQMRQAVQNLLENALFHGKGTTRVFLRNDQDKVVLDIEDDGPAPATDDRERLFDRFHKHRQTGPGSGLGLAIVRQIARNSGGDVVIAHQETFRVSVVLPSAKGMTELGANR